MTDIGAETCAVGVFPHPDGNGKQYAESKNKSTPGKQHQPGGTILEAESLP